MSKKCTVTFSNVSIAAAQDLLAVKAATGKPIRILRYWLTCIEPTLPSPILLRLNAKYTTSLAFGSGGSTPTPVCLDPTNTTTISATAHANDTTQSASTFTSIDPNGGHIYNRFDSAQQGRDPIDIPVGGGFVFELLAGFVAAHFNGGIDFEEIG